MKNDLALLRQQIDEIDRELIPLFEKRLAIVSQVALLKHENKLPVYDQNREEAIIHEHSVLLKDQNNFNEYEQFMNSLFSISKNRQERIITALLNSIDEE